MQIDCLKMGTTCDRVASGELTEELIEVVGGHARLAEGMTDGQTGSDDLGEIVTCCGLFFRAARSNRSPLLPSS